MPRTAALKLPSPTDRAAVQPRLASAFDRILESRWTLAWLTALCLALFLPGFFSIQPLDIGETHIAVGTRRMLDAGGLPRLHLDVQPPGIHWLQAAVVRGLETLHLAHRSGIAAYRFASLLCALAAVLATFHWGRMLVGRRAALLGAVLLSGCAAVVADAHLATAATPFLATMTACMGLLGAAWLRPERFGAVAAAAFWALLAMGVLLQGLVAPLMVLLAGAGLALADRGARWLAALRPHWGVPLMLALALPPLFVATPGIATSLLGGFAGGIRLPGTQLLGLSVTAFPAFWLALLAVPAVLRERASPAVHFLLAWILSAWLIAEALPWRADAILPALPPILLLTARWATQPAPAKPPRALWLLGASALVLVAAAFVMGAAGIAYLDLRELPYAALAFVCMALLVWRVLAHGLAGRMAHAGLIGTLLAVPLYATLLQGTLSHFPVARIADRITSTARWVAPGITPERFGILGFDGASLAFAFGPALHRLPDADAAARFLEADPANVVAILDVEEDAFRKAAARHGVTVEEAGQILAFDPMRAEFVVFLMYRLPGDRG
jgi:4-amino-4-deoxy-L-arabinose transferase-like glycosyltransferase